MLVTVKGKNVEVTDALKHYAEKKVQKLEKYFKELKHAEVTVSIQRNWHIVEIQLEGDGVLLRGEERSDDMYVSIDLVIDKLDNRVKRFKGKLYGKTIDNGPREREAYREAMAAEEAGAGVEYPEEEEAENLPQIVRSKRFNVKPMTAEEAANQMELLHHDFFMFVDSDTENVSVVYKRRDGNYGLLAPAT